MYQERNYMIFAVSELDSIDFTQVLETSAANVRRSLDQTKTFVKWNGDIPACVENLVDKIGPYAHDEMIEILGTEEWTSPNII
jgi:hypothetical protein